MEKVVSRDGEHAAWVLERREDQLLLFQITHSVMRFSSAEDAGRNRHRCNHVAERATDPDRE